MAKTERKIIEAIAFDIAFLSMEYMGDTGKQELKEYIETATDDELLNYIIGD